jgi:hypothetical protein
LEDQKMISLSLSRARTVRVWLGELPPARYEANSRFEVVVDATPTEASDPHIVAVEMKQNRGGRILYGLVGGRFDPDNSIQLRIFVNATSANGVLFSDSLMTSTNLPGNQRAETVFVGLPEDYARAITHSIESKTKQLNLKKAGTILFDCAAYHTYESSESFFAYVAGIALEIMNLADRCPSEAELIRVIEPLNPS